MGQKFLPYVAVNAGVLESYFGSLSEPTSKLGGTRFGGSAESLKNTNNSRGLCIWQVASGRVELNEASAEMQKT